MKSKTILFSIVLIFFLLNSKALAVWPPANWIYQLQNVNISAIVEASPNVVVIDYSSNGDESGEWSSDDIQLLKDSGISVLCYFSIGEAEDYRFYWQTDWATNPPEWLGPENPEWEGNYKVRYWMEGWKDILFGITSGEDKSYLDRIIDQGFDGIYLDIIDAYYYWSEEAPVTYDNAAHEMVVLLSELANYARVSRDIGSDFKIIPQNGEWLPFDVASSDRETYYSAVDGIGSEDVFHPGDLDEDNPYNPDSERVNILDGMVERGKVVLSVDYLTQMAAIENYYSIAQEHSFIPLATTRALDSMIWYPNLLGVEELRSASTSGISSFVYPNPFNDKAILRINNVLPAVTEVDLFNICGSHIGSLYSGLIFSDGFTVVIDAQNLAAGVYYLRVSQNEYQETHKLLLLK